MIKLLECEQIHAFGGMESSFSIRLLVTGMRHQLVADWAFDFKYSLLLFIVLSYYMFYCLRTLLDT